MSKILGHHDLGMRGFGALGARMRGSQIAAQMSPELSPAREKQILDLVRAGQYVLNWVPITVQKGNLRATFWVTGDSLRLGSPEDSFRVAATSYTQQKVADELNAVLPTPFLSDEIYRQAHIKLIPRPQGSKNMGTMTQMLKHHNAVETQLLAKLPHLGFDPKTALIAPVGKDWVVSRRLAGRPTKNGQPAAVNYGWQRTDMGPVAEIGPFPAATGYPPLVVHQGPWTAHDYAHQDYSQVLRFVSRAVAVCTPATSSEPSLPAAGLAPGACRPNQRCTLPDGTPGVTTCMDIYNVGKDPQLSTLLSHEGPVEMRHWAVPYELPVGKHFWGGVGSTPPPPGWRFYDEAPAGDSPPEPPRLDVLGSQSGVGRLVVFAGAAAAGWYMWSALKKRR